MNDRGCDAFLARHLEPGESLLWSGAPAPLIPMSRGVRILVMVGIPVLIALCLLGAWALLDARDDLPELASGFLSVGVPTFSLLGFLWWISGLRPRECYGLTERRVLVRSGPFRSRCEAVDLLHIRDVRLYMPGVVEVVTLPANFVAGASGQTRFPPPKARRPPEGPLLRVRDAEAVRDKILAARALRESQASIATPV